MSNPGELHIMVVKRIFHYLKGIISYFIEYRRFENPIPLIGYSDVDWASNIDNKRSTFGYTFILSEGAISRSGKQQCIVAMSSIEVEYVTLGSAISEALWLRQLLEDFDMKINFPTIVYCDKESAIALTSNSRFHERSKHISIGHHFIRDYISNGTVAIKYCPTQEMTVDILTKSINANQLCYLTKKLGLYPLSGSVGNARFS